MREAHWSNCYQEALHSNPERFLRAVQIAHDAIQASMDRIGESLELGDLRERVALALAQSDLRVLTTAYVNRQVRGHNTFKVNSISLSAEPEAPAAEQSQRENSSDGRGRPSQGNSSAMTASARSSRTRKIRSKA